MRDETPRGPIRPLFEISQEPEGPPPGMPDVAERPAEAKRVLKRLAAIIEDHRRAGESLGVDFDPRQLGIVLDALRDHAQGGSGVVKVDPEKEIEAYCLNRLFEELVEEPSNILYATKTGPDTMRYDAMDSSFWVQCLDLLQKNYDPSS